MILLSGHSLTPARTVPVEALSLTLKERESTASMTPADMEGITTESWFLDDKEPGAGTVWRVRSIGTAYATNTPTVQLEHAISTLKDRILFGEITPATISGGSTCTARQAVEYILRQQGDWVLGQFDYSVTNAYKFDGDSLFDCLEAVTDTLDDPWWSYDMSRYPFRLNITRRSSGVESELRCGRNLRTITRTIDRSGMYTRFYPIGKDDLHLAGTPYVERNANLYGVIEHTETDTSRETDGELRSWANEKLARHAEPVVNIEVEGLELVESTGEALDRLRLGRMCRVPLPEFGTTITERIVSLTYQDKIHQPEVVRITLANNRDDVTRIIAENMKSAGRGGRGSARQAKEDHAWFEDTDEHVAMCAEGIVGTNPDGTPNWGRLSQLIVDGTGIHQMVQVLDDQMQGAYTRIDQNENAIALEAQRASTAEGTLSGRITVAADAITQEVTRATTAEGTLSGRITVTADAINQEVTRATSAEGTLSGRITVEANRITQEVTRATNAESSLSGRITTEAGKVAMVVETKDGQNVIKAGSIVLAINDNKATAHIDADAVYIGNQKSTTVINGKLNASDLTADLISSILLNSSVISTNYMFSKSFEVGTGSFTMDGYSCEVPDAFYALTIEQDGDTYTLKGKHFYSIAWETIGTFSRATTLTGGWSGTVAAGKSYKVTASPQGTTHYSPSLDGISRRNDKSWATNKKSFTQTLYVYDSNGVDLYEENLTFTTTESYDAGYNGAAGAMSWPSATSSEKTSTSIGYPTSGGGSTTKSLELSADASAVYVKLGGTVVLKMAN